MVESIHLVFVFEHFHCGGKNGFSSTKLTAVLRSSSLFAASDRHFMIVFLLVGKNIFLTGGLYRLMVSKEFQLPLLQRGSVLLSSLPNFLVMSYDVQAQNWAVKYHVSNELIWWWGIGSNLLPTLETTITIQRWNSEQWCFAVTAYQSLDSVILCTVSTSSLMIIVLALLHVFVVWPVESTRRKKTGRLCRWNSYCVRK